MKTLYAILTTHCNLSCSHCDIRNPNESYNEDKFLEQIRNFDGTIILFGGEPTIYMDRFTKVLDTGKINSITTNLLIMDDYILSRYKHYSSIGTSWNASRFTSEQYQLWLENIKILELNNIKCTVIITLTEDLMTGNVTEFLNMVRLWGSEYKAIHAILLEHVVADNPPEYYAMADEWLCNVYKYWDIPISNRIIGKLGNWLHACDEIMTLDPDGNIRQGCPHPYRCYVPSECSTCDITHKCRPCQLQEYCTYPHRLAKLVEDTEGNNIVQVTDG